MAYTLCLLDGEHEQQQRHRQTEGQVGEDELGGCAQAREPRECDDHHK